MVSEVRPSPGLVTRSQAASTHLRDASLGKGVSSRKKCFLGYMHTHTLTNNGATNV